MFLVFGWIPLVLPASAQDSVRVGSPSLHASRVSEGSVVLDGRLDESAWRSGDSATTFTQRDPSDGSPASERTTARVLYSSDAIYVGVRAYDAEPSLIRAELSRRDRMTQSDEISIFFDSYHDRRTAFEFAVTPRGSIRDVYYTDEYRNDPSWDPVWEVRTALDSSGWSAEFRIPLTQLRFDPTKTTWGFQVMRRIVRRAEQAYWSPYSKKASGLAAHFGVLDGLEGLRQPKRLELRPYSVIAGRRRPEGTGSVYAPGRKNRLSGGLDLKYGISSDFTLDAAVNPDFGQVEADPAVVNLTAFESFFPEKRQFFVEGAGLFSQYIPAGQIFYSRRIGRSAQGFVSPPLRGTVQMPDETTILTAAKVTGKTGRGLGLGFISALTAEERAVLRDSLGLPVREQPVEPRTHYFAGRAERDFHKGTNTVGITVTAVNRWLPPELPYLRSASYVALMDGVHKWSRNSYAFRWGVAASEMRGSRSAITAAQRSPLRYYQRPEAPHVYLDTSRTSLGGYSAQVNAGKESGSWRYGIGLSRSSPGFDVTDLGFQYAGDVDRVQSWVGYVRTLPQWIFRDYQINATGWRVWTTGGELAGTVFPFIFVGGTFRNNWTFASNPMNVSVPRLCTTCLRGGPGLRQDAARVHYLNVTTDRRKAVAGAVTGFYVAEFSSPRTRNYSLTPTVYVKASETLNGSFSARYSQLRDPAQFVGRRVALDTARYLVGEINQTTASLTARLNWTITSNLSVELYGQPFVSANAFSRFKEVREPRARNFAERFRVYSNELSCSSSGACTVDLNADANADLSFQRPDFHFDHFRSTSVLRWEYRPGSVLFIAWQHGRSGASSDPTFAAARNLGNLFSLPPDNTLLIKANYWISF